MSYLRSGEFLLGTLIGSVLGAGIGLLIAPRRGHEVRGRIKEKATNLVGVAREKGGSLIGRRQREEAVVAGSYDE